MIFSSFLNTDPCFLKGLWSIEASWALSIGMKTITNKKTHTEPFFTQFQALFVKSWHLKVTTTTPSPPPNDVTVSAAILCPVVFISDIMSKASLCSLSIRCLKLTFSCSSLVKREQEWLHPESWYLRQRITSFLWILMEHPNEACRLKNVHNFYSLRPVFVFASCLLYVFN